MSLRICRYEYVAPTELYLDARMLLRIYRSDGAGEKILMLSRIGRYEYVAPMELLRTFSIIGINMSLLRSWRKDIDVVKNMPIWLRLLKDFNVLNDKVCG